MQFALIPQIHLENVLWDCVTLQDRQGFNALNTYPKHVFQAQVVQSHQDFQEWVGCKAIKSLDIDVRQQIQENEKQVNWSTWMKTILESYMSIYSFSLTHTLVSSTLWIQSSFTFVLTLYTICALMASPTFCGSCTVTWKYGRDPLSGTCKLSDYRYNKNQSWLSYRTQYLTVFRSNFFKRISSCRWLLFGIQLQRRHAIGNTTATAIQGLLLLLLFW